MKNMKSYVKENMLKVSSGVANAVFVTVGIGYLLEILGDLFGIAILVQIGQVAKVLLTPALGAGIAVNLNANTLTIFSAMASAALGGAHPVGGRQFNYYRRGADRCFVSRYHRDLCR